MAGETYVSRFGGSALVNLELARADRDFTRRSTSTPPCNWPATWIACRHFEPSLRGRMQASPLLDAAGFTRNLEAAYRQMWTRWCSQPN